MNICVLTIPSNTCYGFDGVSDEAFSLYSSNTVQILNKTSLGFDEELMPGTTDSCYLWSDCDEFTASYGIGGIIEFEAIDSGDEIIDLGDWWQNNIQCGFDLFNPMAAEDIEKAATLAQIEIDRYDT
jgi:hypothetical protein